MLEAVKNSLGITTSYQDNTIQQYIDEVQAFLIDGGVSEDIVNSSECYGLISRGVADLWNYGSGGTRLSSYFLKRATQLALKSKTQPSTGTGDYNELLNKPQIEGVTLMNNKELSDFGLSKLSNRDIENIIGK